MENPISKKVLENLVKRINRNPSNKDNSKYVLEGQISESIKEKVLNKNDEKNNRTINNF